MVGGRDRGGGVRSHARLRSYGPTYHGQWAGNEAEMQRKPPPSLVLRSGRGVGGQGERRTNATDWARVQSGESIRASPA